MKTPFLIGDKIYLRPLAREDLNDAYLSWLNDPEVNRYLESGIFPYTHEQLEQYYTSVTGTTGKAALAIIEKATDKHIGNVKLEPINWVARHTVFGILIGEKAAWGKGYGTEATRLTVEYAFYRLNLLKVSLGVIAENKAAIKVYERLGFVREGVKRLDAYIQGVYYDSWWMSLLRDEYGVRNRGLSEQGSTGSNQT
jgi:RimJ/RimL family protein N-acetyltransferase